MKKFAYGIILIFFILIKTSPVCAQWIHTNLPHSSTVLAFTVNENNIFTGTYEGIYLSSDNGENWIAVNSGLTDSIILSLAASGTNIFAGTTSGVFLSINNGNSWTSVNAGLTESSIFALATSGMYIFAGTDGGAFISTNNGTSWTVINSGLISDLGVTSAVNTFAVYDTILFAGTQGDGVFRSMNNGTNWTAINSGLLGRYVYSLSVADTNLFAATSGGVYLSTNNGANWNEVNFGLPPDYFFSIVVSGTNIFTSTDQGDIYHSTNKGANWSAVDDELPNNAIYALAISDTNLFAGFEFNGVWRRTISNMVTSVDLLSNNIPKSFGLSQNYPNPFNPSTKIRYKIPSVISTEGRNLNIQLKVYDVLGKEVATLVNEEKPAGSYEVNFDAKGLTSGVYFYKLQAGNFLETKKMLLIK